MKPYFDDPWLTVYQGDCRAVLSEMEPESVHCVVTSPPYFGLRDYGAEGQLGLEPTPEQYVESMVAVFREVRRVLRSDGTVWLNLGDSYAGARSEGGGTMAGFNDRYFGRKTDGGKQTEVDTSKPARAAPPGLKPKDLVGIPWRVAFALQADGWYLRSDIIWSKPNPMPESVTDRPTKSHEYLFLLSKSERYYFDSDAVREPLTEAAMRRDETPRGRRQNGGGSADSMQGIPYTAALGDMKNNPAGRNIRSVWTIATQPYPGAHFATFPPKLVEPCIKAGSSEKGVCPECGAPWRRVVERESAPPGVFTNRKATNDGKVHAGYSVNGEMRQAGQKLQKWRDAHPSQTTGWQPSCAHAAEPVPATILDCFAGSGTVGMVAQQLSRRALLIDLNADYLVQCLRRNAQTPLGLAG